MTGRERELRRILWTAAGAFVAVYVLAVLLLPGQRLDYRLWELTSSIPRNMQRDFDLFSRAVMPALAGAILVVDSALRRSWWTILVGAVATVVATAGAFGLRNVLPRPSYDQAAGIPINGYPSTHVTLVATPLVAVVLAIGLSRILTYFYAVLIVAAMAGNTMLFVHRPSDTVGAVLLSTAVVAAVNLLRRPRDRVDLTSCSPASAKR